MADCFSLPLTNSSKRLSLPRCTTCSDAHPQAYHVNLTRTSRNRTEISPRRNTKIHEGFFSSCSFINFVDEKIVTTQPPCHFERSEKSRNVGTRFLGANSAPRNDRVSSYKKSLLFVQTFQLRGTNVQLFVTSSGARSLVVAKTRFLVAQTAPRNDKLHIGSCNTKLYRRDVCFGSNELLSGKNVHRLSI